jgi:hypothetical protein
MDGIAANRNKETENGWKRVQSTSNWGFENPKCGKTDEGSSGGLAGGGSIAAVWCDAARKVTLA